MCGGFRSADNHAFRDVAKAAEQDIDAPDRGVQSTRTESRMERASGRGTEKMRILIADEFESWGVERLREAGCEVIFEPKLDGDALRAAIASTKCAVVIVRSTKVTEPMLAASDTLGVVVRAGAGVNTIDVSAASQRSILVANCPGKNSVAVAELTLHARRPLAFDIHADIAATGRFVIVDGFDVAGADAIDALLQIHRHADVVGDDVEPRAGPESRSGILPFDEAVLLIHLVKPRSGAFDDPAIGLFGRAGEAVGGKGF